MDSAVRYRGAACLLAVFVSVAAGCSSQVTGTGTGHATPAHSAASTPVRPSASAPHADLGSALERIALRDSDLASGYKLRLIPDGDEVRDEVTLDNCGFDFTTEAHRVARRQYVVLNSTSGDTGLSNELVAYDSPAQAAKAITQWHTSAATCPHTPVISKVDGVPDLLMKVIQSKRDLTTLPATTNAITVESGTAAGQGTLYNASILQAHGRFLDIIYLNSDRPFTRPELDVSAQLATATGQRLISRD